MAQISYSPLSGHHCHFMLARHAMSFTPRFADGTLRNNLSLHSFRSIDTKRINNNLPLKFRISCAGGGGGDIGIGRGNGSGDGGSGGWSGGGGSDESSSSGDSFGPMAAFLNGWRSMVPADAPPFAFKVLMELTGVGAWFPRDTASSPIFGHSEVDLLLATLVLGSIMNLVLLYLFGRAMASSTECLPAILTLVAQAICLNLGLIVCLESLIFSFFRAFYLPPLDLLLCLLQLLFRMGC